MDNQLRQLERLAANGDRQAAIRLANLRRRAGKYPDLPDSLPNARMRMSSFANFIVKKNRNVLRLQAHKRGTCNKNCRFCRKYGAFIMDRVATTPPQALSDDIE